MPVIKLTPTFINQNLYCPGNRQRIEYCDSETPGLYIEVRATSPDQGTWYLRYKDPTSKTCHQKLGDSSTLTLPQARKQAKTLKAEIALGADPRAAWKAQQAVLTYADYFEQHYLPAAQSHKRSWQKDESLYRNRLKAPFGHLRLNQITRQQIQHFHQSLPQQGLSAATSNHHLKVLRKSFSLAIDWGLLDSNPASRIPLLPEDNQREHYLTDQELQRLLTVLHTDANRTVCQILLFLLSTGARLNEALTAQWINIDLDHNVWRIRASESKSKRMRSVPLNDSAMTVLQQQSSRTHHAYVFINPKTQQPYQDIHKVWIRLRTQAGLGRLRIHDLRHSYASFLINAGRTLYEVQAILGHSKPEISQRYSHLSSKTLLEAANSASQVIAGVRLQP